MFSKSSINDRSRAFLANRYPILPWSYIDFKWNVAVLACVLEVEVEVEIDFDVLYLIVGRVLLLYLGLGRCRCKGDSVAIFTK